MAHQDLVDLLDKDMQDAFTGLEELFWKELKAKLPPSHHWVVSYKGNIVLGSFEIAVVMDSNEHGLSSWGWFDEEKILISHSGPGMITPLPKSLAVRLLEVAYLMALELNREDKKV